ncbi:MAG: DUF4465 domain-containing protein [Bacteroidetes bacterium]|nr:DUF4465 domain-containing protein [Bacteroidota bacterium]
MNYLKKITFITFLSVTSMAQAQISEGFENAALDTVMLLNGSDGLHLHYFKNGEMSFPVNWDTTYKYWASGWALSKIINNKVEPANYAEHLYSSAAGFGVENGKGKAFMVGQSGSFFYLQRKNEGDFPMKGFYVSNSTYAYNSMKFGDMFAKKFGGANGNDEDSFILVIRCYKKSKSVDSQRVVLADFRFSDSSKDYILNQWKFVNVKDAYTDSIAFELLSSDVGQWGMNTPAFFTLDGVEFYGMNSVTNTHLSCSIYPVPVSEVLNIKADYPLISLKILDYLGGVKSVGSLNYKTGTIEVSQLPQGYYIVQVQTTAGMYSRAIQVVR